ncbi:MAG TPA: retropepsin-like aspartic protease [Gemmataceae bacterium]|nr:retropepsin-like aspartic protease [Gemmataceae bacterium]
MSNAFDPNARSVLVRVLLIGPRREYVFRFILDTGATQTCIRPDFLRQLGIDLDQPAGRRRIRSATGGANVPVFRIPFVSALEHTRENFLVAAQDFPLGVQADGLLGLDFYRGLILRLDFARGRASLVAPSRWRFWR